MAGPIIEPVIKKKNCKQKNLAAFGRNNNRANICFDILFETETTQFQKYAL